MAHTTRRIGRSHGSACSPETFTVQCSSTSRLGDLRSLQMAEGRGGAICQGNAHAHPTSSLQLQASSPMPVCLAVWAPSSPCMSRLARRTGAGWAAWRRAARACRVPLRAPSPAAESRACRRASAWRGAARLQGRAGQGQVAVILGYTLGQCRAKLALLQLVHKPSTPPPALGCPPVRLPLAQYSADVAGRKGRQKSRLCHLHFLFP